VTRPQTGDNEAKHTDDPEPRRQGHREIGATHPSEIIAGQTGTPITGRQQPRQAATEDVTCTGAPACEGWEVRVTTGGVPYGSCRAAEVQDDQQQHQDDGNDPKHLHPRGAPVLNRLFGRVPLCPLTGASNLSQR